MNKPLESILSLLLAVLLFLPVLSGCDRGEKEKTAVGLSLAGAKHPYGTEISKNGIRMYVDPRGVYTTEAVSGGVTLVNTEYAAGGSGGTQILSTRWIGLDGTDCNFAGGTVLRVLPITAATDPETFKEYYGMVDEQIRARYPDKFPQFFRIWAEDANGTEIKTAEPWSKWYIQDGNESICGVYAVEAGADETLMQAKTMIKLPDGMEKCFVRASAGRAVTVVALFTE